MINREEMYIEKFGSEYLTLKEACSIWRKPGYSSLSKKLPKMGYSTAYIKGIIPKYKYISSSYLFRVKDILAFLEDTEVQNG